MVCAGLMLDLVTDWPAFKMVPEIIIVVPPLLGLKGNLEMTLAARMSTAANLGQMDERGAAISTIVGNLVLVQCQGIVVGFLASLCGLAMGWLRSRSRYDCRHRWSQTLSVQPRQHRDPDCRKSWRRCHSRPPRLDLGRSLQRLL